MKLIKTCKCKNYIYPQYDKDGKKIIHYYCGDCDKELKEE